MFRTDWQDAHSPIGESAAADDEWHGNALALAMPRLFDVPTDTTVFESLLRGFISLL